MHDGSSSTAGALHDRAIRHDEGGGAMTAMVDETTSASPRRGTGRLGELAARARRIDARSTWPVAVGALLVPVGIVLILLAWYGSAHTPYIQQQIPYLVSGSFIGLGLMILGGLLYWSHWLYRVYDQANLHHELEMERQEELFARLIDAVSAAGGRADAARAVTDEARPRDHRSPVEASGGVLVATATGTNAHRPNCPVVRRHPEGLRTLTAAELRDAKPCRICKAGALDGPTADDGGDQ
jgi:hypothetical protein